MAGATGLGLCLPTADCVKSGSLWSVMSPSNARATSMGASDLAHGAVEDRGSSRLRRDQPHDQRRHAGLLEGRLTSPGKSNFCPHPDFRNKATCILSRCSALQRSRTALTCGARNCRSRYRTPSITCCVSILCRSLSERPRPSASRLAYQQIFCWRATPSQIVAKRA